MDHTYQHELQLPKQYSALSEEELTYLDGGEYSFDIWRFTVSIHPEYLGETLLTMAMNFGYVLGMGITTAAINGVIKGHNDGLSFPQTVRHFWNRQNTAGRVAALAIGIPLGGYYTITYGMQIYSDISSIITEFKAYRANKAAAAAGETVEAAA